MSSLRPEQLAIKSDYSVKNSNWLRLEFGGNVNEAVRPRISYAFQIFAAIYGYRVAESGEDGAAAIFYSDEPAANHEKGFWVPARYRADPGPLNLEKTELTKRQYAGEDFCFFFGVDHETGNPDWLGEIFEWLSCSYERRVVERDSIGRIPFSHTVFAQQHLSPRKPYAMMAMAWLQNELTCSGVESLPKASSPTALAEHLVVSSHDIDFYFTSKSSALARLFKNLVIGLQIYKSWPFFAWNARQVFRVLAGKRVGDYLGPLLKASREHDFQSTIFAVAENGHRRDPNYRLEDLAADLKLCLNQGFSLGLHGSYQSIIEKSSLRRESTLIQKALAVKPRGGRQHWLRFGQHGKFFETVAGAGLTYDSTLGFAETAGFRNGASFAFPPYDFKNERAYPFLEIPLVLMDGSLEAAARASGENPNAIAEEILEQSRKWGWGGIAADWHNPIEPIQVPEEINQIFWKQVKNQGANREKWINADEFLKHCLGRYQNAGLLTGVRLDA